MAKIKSLSFPFFLPQVLSVSGFFFLRGKVASSEEFNWKNYFHLWKNNLLFHVGKTIYIHLSIYVEKLLHRKYYFLDNKFSFLNISWLNSLTENSNIALQEEF